MSAIVFDLFETLITEWGRPKFTTREIAKALDVDYGEFRREWESLHEDRYLGYISGTAQVLKTILYRLKVSRSADQILEIARSRDESKRRCFETIEPSVLAMLSDLKEMNFKLGIISNCSDEEVKGLRRSALDRYFDAIVLSCETGTVKPNREIYAHCLHLLREDARDCAYIGDGGSDELAGAERAGFRPFKAVWFTKTFVPGYDRDQTYPAFGDPAEVARHFKTAAGVA